MALSFRIFDEHVTENPFISVDGVVCEECSNEILNLAHWPGNRTPVYLKANTSVEMTLRLLQLPDWSSYLKGASVITNHHYDTDGVLACWCLLQPEIAQKYSEIMISAAVAGDYGYFTTPSGVKLDLLITNFQYPNRSPVTSHLVDDRVQKQQMLYEWFFQKLPELFETIDKYESLWNPEYDDIVADLNFIANNGVEVREHHEAVLSVIKSKKWLNIIARWSRSQSERLLSISSTKGGTLFEFQYSLCGFHDRVDWPRLKRPALDLLANYFNDIEKSTLGKWVYRDDPFIPKLHYVDANGALVPSYLSSEKVESHIVNFFSKLGDSWDYYEESPWGRVQENRVVPVVPWP